MANTKLSQFPQDSSPVSTDFLIGINGTPQDSKFAISDLATVFATLIAPASTAWVPTLTGFSVNPTTSVYRYIQIGKVVHLWIYQGVDGTSNGTALTITLPVTAATISGMHWTSVCRVVDNGAALVGIYDIASGGTTVIFGKDAAGNVFTATGAKRVIGAVIEYEAA